MTNSLDEFLAEQGVEIEPWQRRVLEALHEGRRPLVIPPRRGRQQTIDLAAAYHHWLEQRYLASIYRHDVEAPEWIKVATDPRGSQLRREHLSLPENGT